MNSCIVKSIISTLSIALTIEFSYANNLRIAPSSTRPDILDNFKSYSQSFDVNRNDNNITGPGRNVDRDSNSGDADFEDINGSDTIDANSTNSLECRPGGHWIVKSRCHDCCAEECWKVGRWFGEC